MVVLEEVLKSSVVVVVEVVEPQVVVHHHTSLRQVLVTTDVTVVARTVTNQMNAIKRRMASCGVAFVKRIRTARLLVETRISRK